MLSVSLFLFLFFFLFHCVFSRLRLYTIASDFITCLKQQSKTFDEIFFIFLPSFDIFYYALKIIGFHRCESKQQTSSNLLARIQNKKYKIRNELLCNYNYIFVELIQIMAIVAAAVAATVVISDWELITEIQINSIQFSSLGFRFNSLHSSVYVYR